MNLKHLYQHWVHAQEESTNETAVYRSKGLINLAPRRFCMQYIFHLDGRLEWLYLAPDCRHRFMPGSWRLDSTNKNILYLRESGDTKKAAHFGSNSCSNSCSNSGEHSYAIIELNRDRLCLGARVAWVEGKEGADAAFPSAQL